VRISISNIAWEPSEEKAVREIMKERQVRGVEIAPTKIWASPGECRKEQALEYRRLWEDQGIQVVALQALLFGRPELTLFEDKKVREKTLAYLSQIIQLASWMGAKVLVFGSPKNRRVGTLDRVKAEEIAVDFFRCLGEAAWERETCFCIEPNAGAYDCDFVQTAREGLELVKKVNHPGFGLHLDAGIMTLNQEDVEAMVSECRPWLRHFHISEPYLEIVGRGTTDHAGLAAQLKKTGYSNWVSIEMRSSREASNTQTVAEVLEFTSRIYGG
jgi:D-psicose/D-tagatose/L-ribulose 3-epimerase